MNLLFLRGKVPTDRPKEQIMFNSLSECDDVWTQLAGEIARDGQCQLLYWGGKRKIQYRSNFTEFWTPKFANYNNGFKPDVIMSRGGFREYDDILLRHKNAYSIYYGAGRRFKPESRFKDYNLILVDTPEQQRKTQKEFPNSQVELFIKPAADNIFHSTNNDTKKYDAIFCGNLHAKGIKGHNFVCPNFPKDLRLLQLGITNKLFRSQYPHIKFKGWKPRKTLPNYYSQVKFAIVWCRGNFDSCPRVIPEALACNCPLLVFDETTFWRDKYINSQTGIFASKDDFADKIYWMADNYREFEPEKYYKENLSLRVSADAIRRTIKWH